MTIKFSCFLSPVRYIFLQFGKARPWQAGDGLADMDSGGHGRRSGDGSEQAQGSSCTLRRIAVMPKTGSMANTSEQQVIKAKLTRNQAKMQNFGCMEEEAMCALSHCRENTCQHNRMGSCSSTVHGAVHGSNSVLLLGASTSDFNPDGGSTLQHTRMGLQQQNVQVSTHSHNGKCHVM